MLFTCLSAVLCPSAFVPASLPASLSANLFLPYWRLSASVSISPPSPQSVDLCGSQSSINIYFFISHLPISPSASTSEPTVCERRAFACRRSVDGWLITAGVCLLPPLPRSMKANMLTLDKCVCSQINFMEKDFR